MKRPEEIKSSLEACGADECHGRHDGCAYSDRLMCIQCMAQDASVYIAQMEANARIFANQKWVNIDNELPEPGQIVLGYGSDCDVVFLRIDEYNGDKNFLLNYCTHWFPLPQMPEVEA